MSSVAVFVATDPAARAAVRPAREAGVADHVWSLEEIAVLAQKKGDR
jgi:hypothetical protein